MKEHNAINPNLELDRLMKKTSITVIILTTIMISIHLSNAFLK
jgi:hypothetical protein